jgi:hypothetical protein
MLIILIIILMSVIVMYGLITKPKNKLIFGLSSYSIILIFVFLIGNYINFIFNI